MVVNTHMLTSNNHFLFCGRTNQITPTNNIFCSRSTFLQIQSYFILILIPFPLSPSVIIPSFSSLFCSQIVFRLASVLEQFGPFSVRLNSFVSCWPKSQCFLIQTIFLTTSVELFINVILFSVGILPENQHLLKLSHFLPDFFLFELNHLSVNSIILLFSTPQNLSSVFPLVHPGGRKRFVLLNTSWLYFQIKMDFRKKGAKPTFICL